MPVYEYFCTTCDMDFSQMRPMALCGEPATCPVCASNSQRIISAPRLNTLRAEVRQAHQVNERSAHQPKMTHVHRCGPSCSEHNTSSQPALKQVSSAKRPWMLGH